MLSSVERSWAVPVVHMLSSVERSGPFLVPSGKHVRVCARASTVCARRVLCVRTLRESKSACATGGRHMASRSLDCKRRRGGIPRVCVRCRRCRRRLGYPTSICCRRCIRRLGFPSPTRFGICKIFFLLLYSFMSVRVTSRNASTAPSAHGVVW